MMDREVGCHGERDNPLGEFIVVGLDTCSRQKIALYKGNFYCIENDCNNHFSSIMFKVPRKPSILHYFSPTSLNIHGPLPTNVQVDLEQVFSVNFQYSRTRGITRGISRSQSGG